MTVVRLQGGLGNQLFQLTAAHWLREQRGFPVRLDTSWYERRGAPQGDTPRSIEVAGFLGGLPVLTAPPRAVNRVFSRSRWVLRESGPGDDLARRAGRRSWLMGYYQRADLADATRDTLRRTVFTAHPATRAALPDLAGAVGIHVRLGDYAQPGTQEHHGLSSADSFLRAVAAVRAGGQHGPLVAFTDSPELFRDRYATTLGAITVHPAEGAWEALNAMASCAALVMSNSSLSWWAAYLGTQLRGTMSQVVMPVPWFTEPGPADEVLRVPSWLTHQRELA